MTHKLALIGFGTVGQGLAQILQDKKEALRQDYGFEAEIVAVSTLSKGSLYHPDGLNIAQLLAAVKSGALANYPDSPGLERGWDNLKIIRESNASTIVEVSHTNLTTGQPAIDYCRVAFESGKHVVTANKGPVALAYHPLAALAKAKGVRFGIEGTVMSGTPALGLPLVTLAGNEISEVRGIFNGTTNYILTKMEEGLGYEAALKQAQELGYAEADPTADVEGHDAAGKVVILANVVMNAPLTKEAVDCQGITRLTSSDIQQAKAEGKRWKLIGRVKKEGQRVIASVKPEAISLSDPLAGVMGATNAITYECDLLGPITLVGAGAGSVQTGFAILIDLINVTRGINKEWP
ncbi:MAG: homoserine dehydrogenase [Chloroflexi bacterium]|nr:homoserine dehydrogenase [Chloroflexota bacterium]